MKTKLLCLLLLVMLPLVSYSQEKKSNSQKQENGVFFMVEKMPQFPGGSGALMKYLSQNVKYPASAQANNISGRVIVQFVVEADGSITRDKIIRGVDPALDAEALRVIKAMPKWVPGENEGKKVPVKYTVPIVFSLTKDSKLEKPKYLVFQLGQEIKDKSLIGVWQLCKQVERSEGTCKMFAMPILKMLSSDGTFQNVIIEAGAPAMMTLEGNFKQTSESTYAETIKKSLFPSLKKGDVNVINYQFLNDNLIELKFHIEGVGEEITEYWARVNVPEIRLITENR